MQQAYGFASDLISAPITPGRCVYACAARELLHGQHDGTGVQQLPDEGAPDVLKREAPVALDGQTAAGCGMAPG